MGGEKLSVDALLANQKKLEAFRAAIEAIPDDRERVKVTPFIAGLGCLCDQAPVKGVGPCIVDVRG